MASHTVELDATNADFVEDELAAGRYDDVGELVRVAVTLLRAYDFGEDPRKLADVHVMLDEAFEDVDAGRTIVVEPGEMRAYLEGLLARSTDSNEHAA